MLNGCVMLVEDPILDDMECPAIDIAESGKNN